METMEIIQDTGLAAKILEIQAKLGDQGTSQAQAIQDWRTSEMGGDSWKIAAPYWRKRLEASPIEANDTMTRLMAKIARRCIDGDRGVLFMGIPGNGKTTRLRFISEEMGIMFADVKVLSTLCAGLTAIDEKFQDYCNLPIYGNVLGDPWRRKYDLCIDDLGTEASSQNRYGNRSDVMQAVIDARYDAFDRNGRRWRTFLSTNLSMSQLEKAYGGRTYSRLQEMCIFVPLADVDFRRRR